MPVRGGHFLFLVVSLQLLKSGSAWNCSLPGLTTLTAGKYDGRQVNYLSTVTGTSSPQFVVRAEEFEACTGAKIIFADAANVFEDPIADVGTREATGKQLYDGYLMSYSHFPEASALGLAETLNDRIAASNARLRWEDFFSKVQVMGQFRRDNQDDIDFLMFDGDFFVPIVRIDLLEKYNMSVPNTWDELLEQAHFFNGMDLNDDGEPDYGFCHFPRLGAGTWDWWWAELVYSTWATMAQTEDTDQGFYFDLETFEPLVDTPAFRKAARVWKELWDIGGEGCVSDNMATGRCAIGYSPPGCWKGIFMNGVARRDANGTVLWQPTYASGEYAAPYRALPFGSTQVLDHESGLAACTEALCPRAKPIPTHGHVVGNDRASILPPAPNAGELINRAPFYWSGGFGTMIRKSADPAVKDALWDFFVYINSPETSVTDVASYSSWIDSWRRSQLTDEGRNFVVDSTWPEDAYAEHRSAMWNSLGSESNGALNLRIPGIKEYTYEVAGNQLAKYINLEIGEDKLVSSIKAGWERITRERGLIDQLQTYRATLGKEMLDDFQLCQLHRDVMDAIDPRVCRQFDDDDQTLMIVLSVLGAVVGAGLLGGFLLWIAYTVRSKRLLQRKEELRQSSTVDEALVSLTKLHFPMVVIETVFFATMGEFKCHEKLRNMAESPLNFLDTLEDIRDFLVNNYVIFLSHQWLSYTEPDPQKVQYQCAQRAIRQICGIKNWDSQQVYAWGDYFSIPQRNKIQMTSAISSLPIYAASVNVFIILAPSAMHREGSQMCSSASYGRRAWCRAEVLSHSLSNGVNTMYVATKDELRHVSLKEDLMKEALYVFDGELSCCRLKHQGMECCDRERLMMPFLGLYGRLHHMAQAYELEEEKNELVQDFIQTINSKRDSIFPAGIEVVRPHKVEQQVLYKGLLARMRRRVDAMTEEELVELGFATEETNEKGQVVCKTNSRLSASSSAAVEFEKPLELLLKL